MSAPHGVTVRDLRAGDYVVPAKAMVASVDRFASVAVVEFTDGTATAPLALEMPVEIIRSPSGQQSSAVVSQ